MERRARGVCSRTDDAPTIIEVSDYTCVFCRAVHPAVDSAIAAGARVGYLLTPMVSRPHAERGALGAICAEAQGRFREMHTRLMAADEWMKDGDLAREARSAGVIDLDAFNRCISSDSARKRLDQHRALSEAIGVAGTPTFVSLSGIHRGTSTAAEIRALGIDR